ncbi:F-box protein At3g07870-like [Andrographis paniculata]|uniref:F-box protein At3g07870-like n=1 Tax=Andrographis paniculata TaxID=175694 RepID=UPI0021E935EC|nr:F-box protein At3g07870-like [Andrographis paniculata]
MSSLSEDEASSPSDMLLCGLWFFGVGSGDSGDERYLPDDMVIEILTRLPPEELLFCRSVSKSWYSTISDANFIAEYRRKNIGNDRVIVFTTPTPTPTPDESSQFELKYSIFSDGNCPKKISQSLRTDRIPFHMYVRWKLEGTCNGVFCYTGVLYSENIIYEYMTYLCDPSTKRASLMPDSTSPSYHEETTDPSTRFGIGFDSLENLYKIVKVKTFIYKDNRYGQAAVLSLKSMSWKDVECPLYNMSLCDKSVFLHGSIHWICSRDSTGDKCVISFDLCNEVFKQVQLPQCEYRKKFSIHVVGDSLCAMAFGNDDLICHVWMMKEFGVEESWMEQYKVVLPIGILRCVDVTVGGRILCVSDGYDLYEVKNGVLEKMKDKGSETPKKKKEQENFGKYILYDLQSQSYASLCWVDSDCVAFSIESSVNFL